jgi:hypothetical protein
MLRWGFAGRRAPGECSQSGGGNDITKASPKLAGAAELGRPFRGTSQSGKGGFTPRLDHAFLLSVFSDALISGALLMLERLTYPQGLQFLQMILLQTRFLFVCLFVCFETGFHDVAQASFKLMILLLQPPEWVLQACVTKFPYLKQTI